MSFLIPNLRLSSPSSSSYIESHAPASMSSSYALTWPSTTGAGVLNNDGTGKLAWVSNSGASITVSSTIHNNTILYLDQINNQTTLETSTIGIAGSTITSSFDIYNATSPPTFTLHDSSNTLLFSVSTAYNTITPVKTPTILIGNSHSQVKLLSVNGNGDQVVGIDLNNVVQVYPYSNSNKGSTTAAVVKFDPANATTFNDIGGATITCDNLVVGGQSTNTVQLNANVTVGSTYTFTIESNATFQAGTVSTNQIQPFSGSNTVTITASGTEPIAVIQNTTIANNAVLQFSGLNHSAVAVTGSITFSPTTSNFLFDAHILPFKAGTPVPYNLGAPAQQFRNAFLTNVSFGYLFSSNVNASIYSASADSASFALGRYFTSSGTMTMNTLNGAVSFTRNTTANTLTGGIYLYSATSTLSGGFVCDISSNTLAPHVTGMNLGTSTAAFAVAYLTRLTNSIASLTVDTLLPSATNTHTLGNSNLAFKTIYVTTLTNGSGIVTTSTIAPATAGAASLGTSTLPFSELYVSSIKTAVGTNLTLGTIIPATPGTSTLGLSSAYWGALYSNSLIIANGTVGAPSIRFTGDGSTGLYLQGTNDMRIVANGTLCLRVTPSNTLVNNNLIPTSSTSSNLGTSSNIWVSINTALLQVRNNASDNAISIISGTGYGSNISFSSNGGTYSANLKLNKGGLLTVDNNFGPSATGLTSGFSGLPWTHMYASTVHTDALTTSIATYITLSADLTPNSANTRNLGTSTIYYASIYSNTLGIQTLTTSSTATSITLNTDIIPGTTNVQKLGTNANYFTAMHTSYMGANTLAAFAGATTITINSNLTPNANNTVKLGTTALAYSQVAAYTAYVQTLSVFGTPTAITLASDIVPSANDTQSIGTSSAYLLNTYITNAYITTLWSDSSNFITINNNLVPGTDNTVVLGSTSHRFAKINVVDIGFSGTLIPGPTTTSLGTTTNYIANIYVATVHSGLAQVTTMLLNGQTTFDPNVVLQMPSTSSGKAASWLTYSSREFKTQIHTIKGAMSTLMRTRPVTFKWKEGHGDNSPVHRGKPSKQMGFIAEEISSILPFACGRNNQGRATSVDYAKIVPLVAAASQEHIRYTQSLHKRLMEAEKKIELLMRHLEAPIHE